MTENSSKNKTNGKPFLIKRVATKARGFFKGCKEEFGKIIWPGRTTTVKQFAAVICVSVVTAALIAVIDFGAQNLIDVLVTLGTS
jgi:preprotein translocase subunit SecE